MKNLSTNLKWGEGVGGTAGGLAPRGYPPSEEADVLPAWRQELPLRGYPSLTPSPTPGGRHWWRWV